MNRNRESAFLGFIWFAASILIFGSAYSEGTTRIHWSCASYNAASSRERAALTTGYLEGVQAAIDKEMADMLVPPENREHPVWWALPTGEIAADGLETSLSVFCKSKANEDKKLLDALLSIAARKEGSPRTGLGFDEPSDKWRTILGKSTLMCSNYTSASESEQADLVYGYFLGTKAARLALKTPRELSLMVWPEADYRDVKARVAAGCRETRFRNLTIRDVLWLIAVEMGVEKIRAEKRIAARK